MNRILASDFFSQFMEPGLFFFMKNAFYFCIIKISFNVNMHLFTAFVQFKTEYILQYVAPSMCHVYYGWTKMKTSVSKDTCHIRYP